MRINTRQRSAEADAQPRAEAEAVQLRENEATRAAAVNLISWMGFTCRVYEVANVYAYTCALASLDRNILFYY
jgi:hypothetical protein